MIEFLKNELAAKKGQLPIAFRPKEGKWIGAMLLAADDRGMALRMPKGQTSVIPWESVAVVTLDPKPVKAVAKAGNGAKAAAAPAKKAPAAKK